MEPYHKINSIFNRDPANGFKFTDEYSRPEFEYLKDNEWEFTEKVDGTNIRIIWDLEKVRIAGKSDRSSIPTFLYDRLNDLFPVDFMKSKYPDTPMTLYGEGYGAKIQKGGGNYKSDGVDFVLFDVLIDGWWLKRKDVSDVSVSLKIDAVPVVSIGNLDNAINLCKKGFTSTWGDFQAEGLVLRTTIDIKNRLGGRIIAKVKCSDFS